MDNDFLIKHALDWVWCSPDQDNQVIIKPARISPYNGVAMSWKFLMTSVKMPVQNARFHLFQIGQIHPYVINLFPKLETWTKLSESCMLNKTICDIYTANGLQLPRTETWYIVTEERNVIIAVKENRQIPINYNTDPIYIRVYNNEFFNSVRSNGAVDAIVIQGGLMVSTDDILALQTSFNEHKVLPGGIYCFKNGYKIKEITLITCQVNDIVEFVYDASIIKVIDFNLAGLGTFDSILDSKGKYLLHYVGGLGTTIDYQDDIDVFIIDGTTQQGVYFHKNNPDALRMVTHRDYSIPVANVVSILHSHSSNIDLSNAYIRLHVRNSGYDRALVNEHHRIKELYKLDDSKIKQAMLGVDSTVDVWKAAELELSKYNTIMASSYSQVSTQLVSDAYGYNAIVKLAAESFHRATMHNSQLGVTLPWHFQNDATGFEYDINGKLIANSYHVNGTIYNCVNSNAKYVEFVKGRCSQDTDETYDLTVQTLDPNYDYRFYTTPKDGNAQNDVWTDVTNSTDQFTLVGNTLTWLVSDTKNTLVRSNKVTLMKSLSFPMTDGLLVFNLMNNQKINNVTTEREMELPMGELDVFLNGYSLIEGLDYRVNFPTVTIVAKDYLIGTGNQTVLYRFKGHCNTDLTRDEQNDFGFVRNGRLSVDNQFDIRDDKVVRIQLSGALKLRDELVFNEDTNSFDFLNATNGKPYLIKDVIVPIKTLTNQDTYVLKNRSKVADKQISDYLTVKLGTVNASSLNPIQGYYHLYSPFICKVIFALLNGDIDDTGLVQQYNDNFVRNLVAPYLYLLSYDPILPDNYPDFDYVVIHPHHLSTVLDLNIYHYTFIERVIRLYANGLIKLSNHARIV